MGRTAPRLAPGVAPVSRGLSPASDGGMSLSQKYIPERVWRSVKSDGLNLRQDSLRYWA